MSSSASYSYNVAARWSLAAGAVVLLTVSAHVKPAEAFGRKSDICTSANNYCNGPPAQSSPRTYRAPSPSRPARPRGPSAAEIDRRRKKAEATRLNELGISAWNRKDWGAAVRYFEAALTKSPTNTVIRNNLARARNELRWEQEKKKDAREAEAAKARINRMLGGLTDQMARPGSGPGPSVLFDTGDGPDGFPTPSGRVGVIHMFDAPPDGAPAASPRSPAAPAVTTEKPRLYSKGSPDSAPVAIGTGSPPVINPGDLKASNPGKGVKFNEVPPPRNPEGRLPNPLADEQEADAKIIEKGLENAIINQNKAIWPGPTRKPGEQLPNPLADEQERASASEAKDIDKSLENAILNHDKTRIWPGPTRPQNGAGGR